MLKKCLLSTTILFLVNCKEPTSENNDENSVSNTKNQTFETELKPIFIGLSPKMSDEAFDSEINKLNTENKLVNNKFPLKLDEEFISFDIFKKINSITLVYSTQESKSFENISYQISDRYLKKYNHKKEELFKIFDSKYKIHKIQIPKNINLTNYGLQKDSYRLYQDDEKSILLGYTIIGERYPSKQKFEYEKQINNKKTDEHPLENLGKFISSESNNYAVFGIEIEINYFHNDKMESLLMNMLKESNTIKKLKKESEKKESENEKTAKNNIHEL